MIIYEREKKTLIIPTGIGNGATECGDYAEGFSDGKEAQKSIDNAKLTPSKTIRENGEYEANYGFKKVIVDVDCEDCSEAIADAFDSGVTAGMAEQKSRLVSTAITSNGLYERADGYSSIYVDVEAGGDCTDAYNEGFTHGVESGFTAGENAQKAKLSGITINNNGIYNRPDGFSSVTVDIQCAGCNLQTKSFGLGGNFVGTTVTPDNGYDGLSSVNIYDDGYGGACFDNGVAVQKALMQSASFSANGTYTREDGWNEAVVDVKPNLQNKSVSLTGVVQTIGHDSGYDGISALTVDATNIINDEHTSAYGDGYSDGVTAIRNQFTSTAVTENGTYTMTGEFNAFSSFTVSVPMPCDLFKAIVTGKNETICVSFDRPSASGWTVYGGAASTLKSLVDTYERVQIASWDDQAHTDITLQGYFTYMDGVFIFYNYQGDTPYPLDEIGPRWTDTGNNNNIYLWNDGMNIFFYTKYPYGFTTRIEEELTPADLIFEAVSGNAAKCIQILAGDAYESGKDEGYADALVRFAGSGQTCFLYRTDDHQTRQYSTSPDLILKTATTNTYDVDYDWGMITYLPSTLTYMGSVFLGKSGVTDVILPEGIKNTGLQTCYKCPDLVNVKFPASLEIVGEEAFNICGIREVRLGANVTTIGNSSFLNNPVETVYIASSGVTTIGPWAFGAVDNADFSGSIYSNTMKDFYIATTVPPTIDEHTFAYRNGVCTIHVPNGCASAYETAWRQYLPSGWIITEQ